MTNTTRKRSSAVGLLLLIPWLWSSAPGPSTAVVPWLVGAACVAAASILCSGDASRNLLAAAVLALPVAASRAVSPLEPAALAGALVLIALAMGIGAWAMRESQVELLVRVWWVAALASTALALVQYFGLSRGLGSWISPTDAGTAYANLRQRNQFATLTAIGLAALLWETRRGKPLGLLCAAAAFLAVGNAASVSRTGMVELLAIAALTVLWPGRSRRQAVVVSSAFVAYAVAVLALPWLLSLTGHRAESLWERVAGPGACGSRSVLWSDVAHLIGQRPWTGWGWGELDYAHFITLYPGARFCDILDNAHDLPLHLAVEFGLPLAVVVCVIVVAVAARARPWREAGTDRQLSWSIVAVIAMHSLLEYPLWYAPFQLALGLALGMLWPQDTRALPRARNAVPIVFSLALAYAAWDYLRVTQIYLSPEERLAAYREDPLPRIRESWLFSEYATFAELTITPLSRDNAQWQYETALKMLHYSPEPRVVEKVIESATLLGHEQVAAEHLARFRAAFPKEYAAWAHGQRAADADLKD